MLWSHNQAEKNEDNVLTRWQTEDSNAGQFWLFVFWGLMITTQKTEMSFKWNEETQIEEDKQL